MSGNIAPSIITDGLVTYIDFANTRSYQGSGTSIADMITTNTGSLINGPVFDSANSGGVITDGVNDYFTVPTPTLTSLFTINIWVKPIANSSTGSTGYMGLVQRFNGFSGQRNRFLLQSGFNLLYFQAVKSGISTDILSDTFPSIQNQISMCTVSYDGSAFRFYVNGRSVLSTPFSYTGTLDSGLGAPYLGWGASSADYYMNGKFYIYQVYNTALTSSQILQNFNAMKGRFGK